MAAAFEGSRPLYGNPRAIGADQDRYLFWATGARTASGSNVASPAGFNFALSKLSFGGPQYATNAHRLHFPGFASTRAAPPRRRRCCPETTRSSTVSG